MNPSSHGSHSHFLLVALNTAVPWPLQKSDGHTLQCAVAFQNFPGHFWHASGVAVASTPVSLMAFASACVQWHDHKNVKPLR